MHKEMNPYQPYELYWFLLFLASLFPSLHSSLSLSSPFFLPSSLINPSKLPYLLLHMIWHSHLYGDFLGPHFLP